MSGLDEWTEQLFSSLFFEGCETLSLVAMGKYKIRFLVEIQLLKLKEYGELLFQ